MRSVLHALGYAVVFGVSTAAVALVVVGMLGLN
jgi:hypothetical protein